MADEKTEPAEEPEKLFMHVCGTIEGVDHPGTGMGISTLAALEEAYNNSKYPRHPDDDVFLTWARDAKPGDWVVVEGETSKSAQIVFTCVNHRPDLDEDHESAADLVMCQFCKNSVPAKTAHRYHNGWVGDACCWDNRLYSSE